MARPVSWLPRLHEIRRSVSGSVRSHYTSPDLELLLQVQPRAARKLMEALPQVSLAGSKLVERNALVKFLDEVDEAGDVAVVMARRRQSKEAASRRRPRVLVRRDAEPTTLETLPVSIALERGAVLIRFETGQQLAEAMFHLAQILDSADEYARFAERFCVQPAAAIPQEEVDEVQEMIRQNNEKLAVWMAARRGANPANISDSTKMASVSCSESDVYRRTLESLTLRHLPHSIHPHRH